MFPTPEDAPFPTQTSLYAASKLAGEGMIGAYVMAIGFTGVVFRFVSVLGERYTHGHVYDFYRALKRDPEQLRVLGDGRQEKSYMYVGDCVSAIVRAVEHHERRVGEVGVYNLGTDETVVVDESVEIICATWALGPGSSTQAAAAGGPGTVPLHPPRLPRIRSLGWAPQ